MFGVEKHPFENLPALFAVAKAFPIAHISYLRCPILGSSEPRVPKPRKQWALEPWTWRGDEATEALLRDTGGSWAFFGAEIATGPWMPLG